MARGYESDHGVSMTVRLPM